MYMYIGIYCKVRCVGYVVSFVFIYGIGNNDARVFPFILLYNNIMPMMPCVIRRILVGRGTIARRSILIEPCMHALYINCIGPEVST